MARRQTRIVQRGKIRVTQVKMSPGKLYIGARVLISVTVNHRQAKSSESIVAISRLVVTDGYRVVGAHNSMQIMQKITARGCAVSSLIVAFIMINPVHAFEATVYAFNVYGLPGEIAMGLAKGSASL
ncbi:hydroxyethylthiazole kinase [Tanacetum coccineum]|uniref:hydroxyethylthiazole kinase n=1 Tax=Tanacetum coccineum TaxID=301880 RepID=A0ABQ5EQG2_9ASTR